MISICPGRSGGCPAAPPTDPDVTNSVIRFLGNQSLGTTLAHNFAALQAVLNVVDDPGLRKRKVYHKRLKLGP
jgi:hypothetical protein